MPDKLKEPDSSVLLALDGVPSLLGTNCLGCGEMKMYNRKPAPSFVCCRKCFRKLPTWMQNAFRLDCRRPVGASPHGPSIWENRIAAALVWMAEANAAAEGRAPEGGTTT